jgi:hypothetical protein
MRQAHSRGCRNFEIRNPGVKLGFYAALRSRLWRAPANPARIVDAVKVFELANKADFVKVRRLLLKKPNYSKS